MGSSSDGDKNVVSRYLRVLYRLAAMLIVCTVSPLSVVGSLDCTISETSQLSPVMSRLISLRPVA